MMSHTSWKLHQLRGFFIVYLLARFGLEFVLGWDIIRDLFKKGRFHSIDRLVVAPGLLLVLIGFVMLTMVLLGFWLFHHLLKKKNWARILLLIIGWLTVLDAIFSLLLTTGNSGFIPWLIDMVPGMDWQRILLMERLKDILGIIFWGYLIVILQFDQRTKQIFLRSESED